MRTNLSAKNTIFSLSTAAVIIGIGYLDYRVGFGFNLFPLYLLPLAFVAWKTRLRTTLLSAVLAGAVIISKLFLTKHLYAHTFFWYWDAAVKFSLLVLFSCGLWRIRQLLLIQREQSAARITQLNTSLKIQVEQLKAANRELADVSYTISHDLRAPLRHIIGFVELLKNRSGTALDQKSRHYLDVISEATRKMGQLIDGLLAFSQLGRTELVKTRVDLNAVVRDVIKELAEETGGREIQWKIGPLPVVVGDLGMLRQAMFHIVANAVKFTQPRPVARIEIGSVKKGGEATVFVKDNGVGFDSSYINKLFGIFQRLHTAEEFEGTGVGLAHVHRIIERHGGRVWAEGAVGKGATIWFSLPEEVSPAEVKEAAGDDVYAC